MSNTGKDSLTMSVREMAAELGVNAARGYEIARIEGFPVIQVGRRLIVVREAFYKWVSDNAGKKII